MSVQQYRIITMKLGKVITASGFYNAKSTEKAKLHGLDMSKLHAASLFYLPCQPKDPSGAYFKVFKRRPRTPLVVQEWTEKYVGEKEANTFIETPVRETQFGSQEAHASMPDVRSGIDQEAVERACMEWQQCPPGKGNDGFFKLALKLPEAGCHQSEVETILEQQAHYAHSPDQRLTQIPSIMASLQHYNRLVT